MYILQNESSLVSGRTVSYTLRLAFPARTIQAVNVEIRNQAAELDNGELVPLRELRLVSTDEQWLPVREFAERYLISSYGKVVSLFYGRSGRQRLLQVTSPQRYPSVSLYNGERVTQVGVNRLVAQHFLPPPVDVRFNHLIPKDGNHLNLRVENLQWADKCERKDEAVLARFHRCGARNANSKLTPEFVQQIRALATQGSSHQQLATQFGVSRPTISLLVRRLSWQSV